MLDKKQRIILFAEGAMGSTDAKMTEGIIRYGDNPVVAVIDSKTAGKTVGEVCHMECDIPIVATPQEAMELGAEVLVLGTAPSGGRVPDDWMAVLEEAVDAGLSLINGLHDRLNDVLGNRLKPGQWIWDVRTPVGEAPGIADARAAALDNTRVLMIGTDMAIGKMTAGLELHRWLRNNGVSSAFIPTGQIGVSIMGTGIPLDALKVDHACGAVEREVLKVADHDIVIVEGQGSLLNPGSSATLPLMRGSCPNKMILCHRAGMEYVDVPTEVKIPPLNDVIHLNEILASAAGALTEAKVVAIALNTRGMDEETALAEIEKVEQETGLPTQDVVRFDAGKIARTLL